MNRHSFLRGLAACLLVASASVVLAQAGSGTRFRVTTSMEMPGMGMSMPGQTQEVCGPKNQASEKMVPAADNCQVTDYRVVGNKSSFRMRCTGEGAMEGTGEFEQLGPDAYRGKMDMSMEGQRMIMRFDGKKVGDCNYATESPEAQGRAMMAKSCADMLRAPGNPYQMYESFTGPGAMCAADKPKFCARVTPMANDPAALREAETLDRQLKDSKHPGYLWQALAGCGLPRATVVARACARAEATADLGFIADFCPEMIARNCPKADAARHPDFLARHCPVQAQAAAAQHCVSRGFTAGIPSQYANFCNRMSAERLRGGRAAPGAQGQPAQPAEEEAKPEEEKPKSWRDRLRDAIG